MEPRTRRNATRRSPPLRTRAPPPANTIAVVAPQLLDLQQDEEDARYLLSGDCPPPHVFQRWADRFQRDRSLFEHQQKQQHLDKVEEKTEAAVAQRAGGPTVTPSPEAVEPSLSAADAGTAGFEKARSSAGATSSTGSSTFPDALGGALAAPTAAAVPLHDTGRSASRQRQCSERNRAWVMERYLDDNPTSASIGGAGMSLQEVALRSSGDADAEYNATGRYAPDPQIFLTETIDDGVERSVSPVAAAEAVVSPPLSKSSTSPSPAQIADEPSATQASAQPTGTSSETAFAPDEEENGGAASAPSALTLHYPCEETYEAPLGSERDAWLILMDDFIEGLVKLMSSEA